MTSDPAVLDATARLRAALEETADALAAADLDRMLHGELALQLALETLTSRRVPGSSDRQSLRREIEQAGRALRRCRRLGQGMLDMVRLSLEAQGRAPAYGRRDTVPLAGGASGVNARG